MQSPTVYHSYLDCHRPRIARNDGLSCFKHQKSNLDQQPLPQSPAPGDDFEPCSGARRQGTWQHAIMGKAFANRNIWFVKSRLHGDASEIWGIYPRFFLFNLAYTHTVVKRTIRIVPRSKHSTIGDRAFPVAAAKIWNTLPADVTSAPSLYRHSNGDWKLSCYASDSANIIVIV